MQSQIFSINQDNPQARLIQKTVQCLAQGAVIALPTDASYVFACALAQSGAMQRIRQLRELSKHHPMTLLCRELAEAAHYARIENKTFKLIKRLAPGPFTFILPATKAVPKKLLHPKRKTIGIRLPNDEVCRHLLSAQGEALVSSSLRQPQADYPLADSEAIFASYKQSIDIIIDTGRQTIQSTTVINCLEQQPKVVRHGLGDIGDTC